MKHIYLLICIISLSSCSLDIPLKEAISGDNAISSTEIASEVVNGAYKYFPKSNLDLSILSEDFAPTHLLINDIGRNNLYKWDHKEISILSSELWNNYYSSINAVNKVLESENYILQNSKSDDKWDIIKGRALALKAHAYYDLLNLFSGRFGEDNRGFIPKNNVKEEENKALTYAQSIEEIEKILKEALQLLSKENSNDINKLYHNQYSVKALQAKTALLAKDYIKAISIGENLLTEISIDNDNSAIKYKNLWNNTPKGSGSNELLFALDNDTPPFRDINFSHTSGDYFFIPSHLLCNSEDIRHNVAYFEFNIIMNSNSNITHNFIGKYRIDIKDESTKVMVQMRIAEIYFVLAEAHLKNNSPASAVQMLNRILKNRNATLISESVSPEELEKQIQLEKQKEFIGEGSNYFDLKRWNTDIKIYSTNDETKHSKILKTDYRWNFPIPMEELKGNKNATQNSGWSTLN